MKGKPSFATQALLIIVLFNAVLVAVLLLTGGNVLVGVGAGVALTLGLWFSVQRLGARLLEGAAPAALPQAPAEAPAQPARVAAPSPDASAIQILSILQRQGRLIDFLQEDLNQFADDQIGAAVRPIHEGCKKALAEYVTLAPIFDREEGSTITVEPGFDAHAIRLTGNVVGDPPFKGALRHRGWRVVRLDLPERMPGRETSRIVAVAEVEVR